MKTIKYFLMIVAVAITCLTAKAGDYSGTLTNFTLLSNAPDYSTNGWLVSAIQIVNASTNTETFRFYDNSTATNRLASGYNLYATTNYTLTTYVTNTYTGSSGTSSNVWTNVTAGVYTYPTAKTYVDLPILKSISVPASTTYTETGLKLMFARGAVVAAMKNGTNDTTESLVNITYSRLR